MTDADTIKKTGTTTVGIICKDAVVLATEKKAMIGWLVESKEDRKIYKLDEHIALTTAGGAGDAQTLVRIMKAQLKLFKLERGPATIKAAATLLSNILQGNKYFPYYVHLLLAGYDSEPHVYAVDAFGALSDQDKFYSTGSGSPMAYGVLESQFKEGLSQDEAIKLVIRAIKSAVERDVMSGGKGLAVAIIDKNGFRELTQQEIKQYAG